MAEQPSGMVTLLFTDIEGSTRLLERLGRDRYAESLDLHRRLLREAFEPRGGYEVDCEGDAFFVAFARAVDAVTAAASAQQALAQAEWPEGLELRVRIGIHTGEPLAVPPKYVGLDVHRAARIMAAGHGRQVLLSEATRKLIGSDLPDGVRFRDLGEHRLKDLLQPEPLSQLVIDGLENEFPALKTLGNRPTNLPVQPNPLIGRERELEEIRALVREEGMRVLTLTGPGGTGKTRLALQLGAELLDEFRSGVFFVSLAPLRDPDLVVPTIAQTLALREMPGEEPIDTLTGYLREKQMLLVLDNFEQVVDGGPPLSKLLGAAPGVKALVTSRERLRISAERVFEVPPLELPDPVCLDAGGLIENEAVALFLSRAQAVKPEFALTAENGAAIAEICLGVDGLPLAIELAAARTSVLTPQALLRRLDRRLVLLTGGVRDAEDRQQTLRKTIEWSYDLLSEPEQALFARLSVFVGGCRSEAAEAVCDHKAQLGIELLDGLQSLVEKSLLRQRCDADGEPRFWMLETIREYANERLTERREAEAVRNRHAEHFWHLAEEALVASRGVEQGAWNARMEAEHDNFRATLSWLLDRREGERAFRTISGLSAFWIERGHAREGVRWAQRALAIPADAPPLWRAKGMVYAAELLRYLGEYERAIPLKEESLALFESLGDQREVAATLHDLGEIAFSQGDYRRARDLHERSLAVREEIGDRGGVAHALTGLASLALEEGDYERAIDLSEQILATGRERGVTEYVVIALQILAEAARRRGDLQRADPLFREALALAWEVGDLYNASALLDSIARVRASRSDLLDAARLWGASEALRESAGAQVWDRHEYGRCLADARARIAAADFQAAWNAGREMDAAQAVADGLDAELDPTLSSS